jgi:hypothetical protein
VTKEWVEEDDGTVGRLILYIDDVWVLAYEIPQPLVIVLYSFEKLG